LASATAAIDRRGGVTLLGIAVDRSAACVIALRSIGLLTGIALLYIALLGVARLSIARLSIALGVVRLGVTLLGIAALHVVAIPLIAIAGIDVGARVPAIITALIIWARSVTAVAIVTRIAIAAGEACADGQAGEASA
jgi:hypothetical protein